MSGKWSVLELCAGGGGQALGLEMAGFGHAGLLEYEAQYCTTLRMNRPHWNVLQQDIRHLRRDDFAGVELIAAGVPCPPFSVAGKQLGRDDERDMFPTALDIVSELKPRAVLFENVPGFAAAKFEEYRNWLLDSLSGFGYTSFWTVLQASDFGVPQLRPRFVLVALRPDDARRFSWPEAHPIRTLVGPTLVDLMAMNGWRGAEHWAMRAQNIAPTLVGGSTKHGGPDLGPTRAKRQWLELGVDGMGIADSPPDSRFPNDGNPRLTLRMVSRIQSFPDSWIFSGGKTAAYRQIGNALPPLVSRALGEAIASAFSGKTRNKKYAATPAAIQTRLLERAAPYRKSPKQKRSK